MKCKIAKITTALAAAGMIIGASVWAAEEQSDQSSSGQPGQSSQDQSSQSSQSGQSGMSQDQSSQSGQMGQQGAKMGQPGSMAEAAEAEFQRIAENPQEFIQHAYQNNLTEIQLGQLAQQKGQSQEVKQFGQHLVQGHKALNDKLTQLAQQKNIQLSKQLDARHQKMIDRVSELSGQDFDKFFTRQQVMSHRRDVALYQRASQSNTDSDVKSFAQTSLPSLKEHLQMAQQQAGSINEAAGAGQGQQGGMSQDQYKGQGQQGQSGQDQSQQQSGQQGQENQQQQQPQQQQ